ncbi:MAG: dockerin type I domain-containing protein [Parcubacteria group bacterium]
MEKKFQKQFYFGLIIFLLASPLVCLALSSTSYQIDPSGLETLHQNTTSSSYQLEGSLEPVIGSKSSSGYGIDFGSSFAGYCGDGYIDPSEDCEGASLNSQTCVTLGFLRGTLACSSTCAFVTTGCNNDSDNVTGGAPGTIIHPDVNPPANPSFDDTLNNKQFTYLSSLLFFGVKDSSSAIWVNDSLDGVTFPTDNRWQKTLSMSLGNNAVVIKAQNANGFSDPINLTIARRQVGDANSDSVVNDYDFSLLANHWNAVWPLTDFNEDGTVNDYDLSLMGAYWTK